MCVLRPAYYYTASGVGCGGDGGGSGAYIVAIISPVPSSGVSFSVGSGGAGGAATGYGLAGLPGGGGIIIVEEYYD